MKKTYTAPTVTAHGDVLATTLGTKAPGSNESAFQLPGGGSNLSFGL